MRVGTLMTVGAVLAIAGGTILWVLTIPSKLPHEAFGPRQANLDNGQTLFRVGGCASCHATPNQDDKTRLGGGLALNTPFGVFRVPNISSDKVRGIGNWTERDFANAMLRGVSIKGEHLYPSFPYTSYQRMTLSDVRDLFAYLKTLPADSRGSGRHELTFPFNVRRAIGLWKLLHVDGRAFTPDPAKSAALNRGAYLVEGPGHCGECHSPRNALGGIVDDRRFAGAPNLDRKGWVPNITPHEEGLAAWSEKDIAYLLESGMTPEYDSVGSNMADVVTNTAKLTPEDRAAMAAYLKSLPPLPGKAPPSSP